MNTDVATDEMDIGSNGIVFLNCFIPECVHKRVMMEKMIASEVQKTPVTDA